jgi:hypothetical protein
MLLSLALAKNITRSLVLPWIRRKKASLAPSKNLELLE